VARYAEGTSVPSEKSKAEIETVLRRYGATGFLSGWDGRVAFVSFIMKDRQVKLRMMLPDPADRRFTQSQRGRRAPEVSHSLWEASCRQSWRAMLLVIKAKLEAIEAGISVFDDEFLAHIVMPDGKTVSEHVRPKLDQIAASGTVQRLLPDYSREGA
jgi:hypothetical protein